MIPHERSLVKKYENDPFALIGIYADSRESYDKGVKETPITWRNFMEGAPDGPVPTRWNMKSWSTFYLIDHKGVIRDISVGGGEQMELLLDKLVEEAKTDGM